MKEKGKSTIKESCRSLGTKARQHLFDIAACKYKESLCKCNKTRRVPIEERAFLSDQIITRNMATGDIDKTIAERKSKRMIRQLKAAIRRAKEVARDADTEDTDSSETRKNTNFSFDSEQRSAESDVNDRDDVVSTTPSTSIVEDRITPNRRICDLPVLARTCDRYSVSDRAAAAIASAVLEDVGLITNEDKTSVIDRNKL